VNQKPYAYQTLPKEYTHLSTIDLANNKEAMKNVNMLSLVLLVAVFLLGFVLRPGFAVFAENKNLIFAAFLAALMGFALYAVLHEAVHGLSMWYFSKRKPRFGVSLQYAYAGSDAYFARLPYLVGALAPLVVWSIVLLIAALLTSGIWFWVVWFVQAGNVSGSAGDLYVFVLVRRMPKDILVQDDGVSMRIYAPVVSQET